jgi:tetratricopeptide (TPR) repeat protein
MGQLTLRDYLQSTEDAISAGRIDDALESCQHILAHYPHSLEAQRLLGEAYLAQGQLEKAQQAFDWVLTNDPENVVTYCSRALISQRMNDFDTALDCYQQAYELSRGNSQIRREFNQLSLRVGQSHFVFSRAGLARLYMRGDLLPQAIQEWETILAATPDRLDAQTGLLEAYWREGWYDKIEQLAQQILDEVPGCLKALLLLAHVTYPKHTGQTQQYLQLAETLDPDMVMARELFSDMIASQPADPFWALLKKPPVVIDQEAPVPAMAAVSANGNGHATGSHNAVTSSSYPDSLVRWDSLDSILEPQQEYRPGQEAASLLNWAETDDSANSWASVLDEPTMPAQLDNDLAESLRYLAPQTDAAPENIAPADGTEAETPPAAPELYEAPTNPPTGQADAEQSWYPVEMFEEIDAWNKQPDMASANPLAADNQDSELPAPPAWLEMLTGSEWQQPGEAPATSQPAGQPAEPSFMPAEPVELPSYEAPSSAESRYAEPDYDVGALFQDQDSEDEEELSFGPQWLRSLGASVINDEATPASSVMSRSTEAAFPPVEEPPVSFPPAAPPVERPQPAPEPVFQQQMPASQTEAFPFASGMPDVLPENDGETPSQSSLDNWISQAAEKLSQPDQNVLTTLEALENDLRSRGFVPLAPGTLSAISQEEPSEPAPLSPPDAPTKPLTPENLPNAPAEPLWAATVNFATQTPMPPAVPPLAPAFTASVPAAPEPAAFAPSMGSPDFLLDADLETTMKRPAIHLQPMAHQPSSQASSALRRYGNERAAPRPATEGNLSNKERLLKGYQYQLAGSYDEAMQEYRLIIRNAPELLGEIISNMRALLKIAPKYGPGYRVLGDAYMRQGEYLQAMEAYNKALSMTRKAK